MALNSTRINKIGNDASVPAPAIAPRQPHDLPTQGRIGG